MKYDQTQDKEVSSSSASAALTQSNGDSVRTTHHQCHRTAQRGILLHDQTSDRLPLRRDRAHAPLGAVGVRTDLDA